MDIQHAQTKLSIVNSIYQSSLESRRGAPNFTQKSDQATISKEGLAKFNASLKLNNVSEHDPLVQQFRKAIEEYNSPEAVEQRRLEQLENEQSFNRLTDEFSIKAVTYHFPKNTLHHTI